MAADAVPLPLVKLARFILTADPATARSGMVYDGRVFETQGAEPVGVHEASDIRLLAPMARPSTVRIFGAGDGFRYANPGAVFGPTEPLLHPGGELRAWLGWAAVIGGHGERVPAEVADDLVLGLALAVVFQNDAAGDQGFDAGIALGPLLITPDEFDDAVALSPEGRVYQEPFQGFQNGEPRFEAAVTGPTLAAQLSRASHTCALREGDLFIFAVGQIPGPLEPGEEVAITSPRLGTLKGRIVKEKA